MSLQDNELPESENDVSEETAALVASDENKARPQSEANRSAAEGKRESYQVVARRYRPQNFETLIGQEHIAKALVGAIKTGRIGHAYLFTGARGVGKTSSARILAKALNCVQGPTPTPCNECEICKAISVGEDIDVLEIDGASNRGIDEIRALRQGTTIRPSRSRYKIYIIDEVHMLTREAFNALLKTLEEPPEHVKFIFCTTEPNKLPITILSRCQRFDFAGINAQTIAKHLEYIAHNEGIQVEDAVCETLARRANGSMRDAQSLLEQLLSFAPDSITLADVHGMLGTVDDQKIFDLLTVLREGSAEKLFPLLNRAADEGVDFGVLLEQMLGTFRDLLVTSSGCGPETLIYSNAARFDELQKIAREMGPERILASMQILDQTISRIRFSTQGRILAEMAFVRLCHLGQLEEISRLIAGLRQGRFPNVAFSAPGAALAGSEKKTPEINAGRGASTPAQNRGGLSAPSESKVAAGKSGAAAPNAAPVPPIEIEKIDFSRLTRQQLNHVWKQAVAPLGIFLAPCVDSIAEWHWEPPQLLRLGFPAHQTVSYNQCKEKTAQIAKAIAPWSAGPIQIEFYKLKESESPAPERHAATMTDQYLLLRQKIQHPLVAEAEKLFRAQLVEVHEGRMPPKKTP